MTGDGKSSTGNRGLVMRGGWLPRPILRKAFPAVRVVSPVLKGHVSEPLEAQQRRQVTIKDIGGLVEHHQFQLVQARHGSKRVDVSAVVDMQPPKIDEAGDSPDCPHRSAGVDVELFKVGEDFDAVEAR